MPSGCHAVDTERRVIERRAAKVGGEFVWFQMLRQRLAVERDQVSRTVLLHGWAGPCERGQNCASLPTKLTLATDSITTTATENLPFMELIKPGVGAITNSSQTATSVA